MSAGPVRLVVEARGEGQHAVETHPEDLRDARTFDAAYVCLSGYTGPYSPHLFAAAPKLLQALQALIAEYEPNLKTFALNAPRRAIWESAVAAVAEAERQPEPAAHREAA